MLLLGAGDITGQYSP